MSLNQVFLFFQNLINQFGMVISQLLLSESVFLLQSLESGNPIAESRLGICQISDTRIHRRFGHRLICTLSGIAWSGTSSSRL